MKLVAAGNDMGNNRIAGDQQGFGQIVTGGFPGRNGLGKSPARFDEIRQENQLGQEGHARGTGDVQGDGSQERRIGEAEALPGQGRGNLAVQEQGLPRFDGVYAQSMPPGQRRQLGGRQFTGVIVQQTGQAGG